jgi:HAD superfamily hydrolase (TIGR01509 family)
MWDMNTERRFDAVIFDCDGVLVDSEEIAIEVWVEMAAEYGYTLSPDAALKAFRGGEMAQCVAHLETLLGHSVRDDFVPDFRARSTQRFEKELKPIPGVQSLLDRLTLPYCVASNGPFEKMEVSLRVTGLWDYFDGRIVSAYRVGSFKPLPGLFLAAADLLQVNPRRCAVVEDSLPGVEAGVAAGMSVFAICPPENSAVFEGAGARPFHHLDELFELVEGLPST